MIVCLFAALAAAQLEAPPQATARKNSSFPAPRSAAIFELWGRGIRPTSAWRIQTSKRIQEEFKDMISYFPKVFIRALPELRGRSW